MEEYYHCLNPQRCAERASDWAKKQKLYAPIGESERKELLKRANVIHFDRPGEHHAHRRSFERSADDMDIIHVVKTGRCIFRNKEYQEMVVRLLILGNSLIYRQGNGVFHVVLEIPVLGGNWHKPDYDNPSLITVYDPATRPWQWAEAYSKRICFCHIPGLDD